MTWSLGFNGQLRFDDKKINLTKNEAQIVRLLMNANGDIVSQENIRKGMTSHADEKGTIVATVINHIRGKMQRSGMPSVILSHRLLGYSWNSKAAFDMVIPAECVILLLELIQTHPDTDLAGKVTRSLLSTG